MMKQVHQVPQVLRAEAAMARAIDCARLGLGKTFPTPLVGAVITNASGEVLGEGFHQGGDHAEVIALNAAKEIPAGSIIYISLEPCNHHGKTPPCVDAIINAGIEKVVYAVADPNPAAAGGADHLRAAGIKVESGIGEVQSRLENRAWLTKMELGRPRITWKIASTMDGKVAASDGSSKWITGELARTDVAQMRSQVDAIVTSTATVIADDPLMTSKGFGKNPVRIVMGTSQLNPAMQIFDDAAETVLIKSRNFDELFALAKERGFNELLIESGPTLGTALLRENLIDEIVLFQAPTLLGSGTPSIGDLGITNISGRLDFEISDVEVIGSDLKITLFKSANSTESGR
jgi:diaminohydroxyphosphoribosylaminopyrimidine deaminase/5-amino-6-(5-phosphoribosylamino)uracil reductase